GQCRVRVLTDAALVEGCLPAPPERPVLQGQPKRVGIDWHQQEGVGLQILTIPPLGFKEVRLPLVVRNAAARPVIPVCAGMNDLEHDCASGGRTPRPAAGPFPLTAPQKAPTPRGLGAERPSSPARAAREGDEAGKAYQRPGSGAASHM